jgi:hypothetical protein
MSDLESGSGGGSEEEVWKNGFPPLLFVLFVLHALARCIVWRGVQCVRVALSKYGCVLSVF